MRLSRADVQIGTVVLGLVILGIIVTFGWPRAPLVPFWLLVALVGGVWISVERRLESLSIQVRRLLLMYAVLMPAAVLSTQTAARRQATATHLQYRGVILEMVDSISIGSGAVDVDIRFPAVAPSQLPWRLTLSRDGSGWSLDGRAGAELVKLHSGENDSPWASNYQAVNGVVLDKDGDRAVLTAPGGQLAETIVLRREGGSRWLETARGRFELDAPNDRIEHRHLAALAQGTRLGSLPGSRTANLLVDQLVRIQQIAADQEVGESAVGWFGRLRDQAPGGERRRRILVSATAPYRMSDPSRASPTSYALGDSTRVEVHHDGGRWVFDLQIQKASPVERRGMAIRFVRNPRPMDTPLPTGSSCPEDVACGLMSLQRLPPPIPHVSLESAGFDGNRYGLLTRLVDRDGRIVAYLPRDTMVIEGEQRGSAQIPVEAYGQSLDEDVPRHERPSFAVLVSSSSAVLDEPLPLMLASLGVFFLLLLVVGAVATSATRAAPGAWESRRWAVVLGANSLLSLILVRLVFGARVSFFQPYLEAGLATAIGLVVATAIVCVGLLRWTAWAPRSIAFAYARPLRSAVPALWGASVATASTLDQHWSVSLARLAALGLLSAGAILFTTQDALVFGAICGVAVLGVWYAVAWMGAFTGPSLYTYHASPFEVVEHADWRHAAPNGLPRSELALGLMAVLWAIILISLWVGLTVLLLGSLCVATLRTFTGGGSGSEAGPGWIRGLREVLNVRASAMLGASTVGIGLIGEFGSNGAVGAFLLVTLLILLSVRFGRRLASDYAAAERSGADAPVGTIRTLVLLLSPVFLLAPLAAIDMGLLLVMLIPVSLAPLMALGWGRLRAAHWVGIGLAALVLGYPVARVIAPDLSALAAPATAGTELKTERFEELQRLFGFRPPVIGGSLNRAAARAVGARGESQRAAEELLLWAEPGPARDLLIPSVEQAWAARAYSASGPRGVGMGEAPVGHGIAEPVSYAENTFSVFVLHEHGFLAGVMVLIQYAILALSVLMILTSTRESRATQRAGQALFVSGVLVIVIPACYVALSNIGILPITGQNMPFLGLNAWSDVTLCAAVIGILLMGSLQSEVQNGTSNEEVT